MLATKRTFSQPFGWLLNCALITLAGKQPATDMGCCFQVKSEIAANMAVERREKALESGGHSLAS